MSKSFLAKSLICASVALATVSSASAQYAAHDFAFLADLPSISVDNSPCGKQMWDDAGNIPITGIQVAAGGAVEHAGCDGQHSNSGHQPPSSN